jgi:alpha-tubulin suppressor-like RCC1 family protein
MVWGSNDDQELGFNGPDVLSPKELQLTLPELDQNFEVVQVATGAGHTLVLTKDHVVFSWGLNSKGQLGLGDFFPRGGPTHLLPPPGVQFSKLACGAFFSMALTSDGRLFAWGDNHRGNLGLGHNRTSAIPTRVTFSEKILDVACGSLHTLALTSSGAVYGWGRNVDGEIGLGFTCHNSNTPGKLWISEVIQISAIFHSMALTRDGSLYVWGWNSGSLGLPGKVHSPTLLRKGVIRMAAGGGHSLALLEDGELIGWGCDSSGQLGLGSTASSRLPSILPITPTLKSQSLRVASFGCLYDHSFLVTDQGDLYTWGLGSQGRLGLGDTEGKMVPTKVGLRVRVKMDKEGAWRELFKWLFLGMVDAGSNFDWLFQDIVYYFIRVEFQNFL